MPRLQEIMESQLELSHPMLLDTEWDDDLDVTYYTDMEDKEAA